MPNHCDNKLTVEGPPKEVQRWMADNIKPSKQHGDKLTFSFEHAVPMPEELRETVSPVRLEGADPTTTKEKAQRLRNEHGADNWYDWACNNWGTKWDAYDYEHVGGTGEKVDPAIKHGYCEIKFTTAWCPPEEYMEKMAGGYGQLTFMLIYAVEGDEPFIRIEATERP